MEGRTKAVKYPVTTYERHTTCWLLMTISVAVVFLALLDTNGLTTPTPQPVPTAIDVSKIDYSKLKPEDIEATEAHRNQLKGEVEQAHDKQAEVIASQGSSIKDIKSEADRTEVAFRAYKDASEAQITKGNEAIAALDHVLKKLHLAKLVVTGVWLALCAVILIKFKGLGLYVVGGIAVSGMAWIWILL